jgi:cytochrome c biogenesis protein CcdA
MILISLLLALLLTLINLLLLPLTIIRRIVARWVKVGIEAGRWLFFLALAVAAAGATMVTGGILLIVAVFFGYISLFTAALIYLASCLAMTIGFYWIASRARGRVLQAIGE